MPGVEVLAVLIVTELAAAFADAFMPPRVRRWLDARKAEAERMRPFNDR